jgi:prevent-host-death family protein
VRTNDPSGSGGTGIEEADLIWSHVVMKRVKIAELKSQLSKHLRAVELGAEIEVTDRERPIARIVPARPPQGVAIEAAEIPVSS